MGARVSRSVLPPRPQPTSKFGSSVRRRARVTDACRHTGCDEMLRRGGLADVCTRGVWFER
jgi:hypothetical protein